MHVQRDQINNIKSKAAELAVKRAEEIAELSYVSISTVRTQIRAIPAPTE